jgi:dihydroorotase-like cyclic amidohydrolase
MAQVDVVVVPSTWPEVFALVVTEAFACFKPVLAARIGGLADVVLIDPKATWKPSAKTLLSKSGNNPLLGRTLKARIRSTFVGGQLVTKDGQPAK